MWQAIICCPKFKVLVDFHGSIDNDGVNIHLQHGTFKPSFCPYCGTVIKYKERK